MGNFYFKSMKQIINPLLYFLFSQKRYFNVMSQKGKRLIYNPMYSDKVIGAIRKLVNN